MNIWLEPSDPPMYAEHFAGAVEYVPVGDLRATEKELQSASLDWHVAKLRITTLEQKIRERRGRCMCFDDEEPCGACGEMLEAI